VRRILLYLFVVFFFATFRVQGAEAGTDRKDGARCTDAEVAAFLDGITLRTALTEDEKRKLSGLKKDLEKDGVERKTIGLIFKNNEFGLYDVSVALFGENPEKKADSGEKTYEWYSRCLGVEDRITRAGEFMETHKASLAGAEKRYGVERSYIVSILSVESDFSRDPGRFKAVNSLVTQYLLVEGRRGYAYRQLKEIIRYSKRTGIPFFDFISSYAGAIGCAQFIPGSLNSYFVGRDGRIEKADPFDIIDCIYSVAYYLKVAGWDRTRNGKTPLKGSRNWKAIHAYNHSDVYTRLVIEMARRLKSRGY
jgi:membrane-bound lytic murein transglycosylase B